MAGVIITTIILTWVLSMIVHVQLRRLVLQILEQRDSSQDLQQLRESAAGFEQLLEEWRGAATQWQMKADEMVQLNTRLSQDLADHEARIKAYESNLAHQIAYRDHVIDQAQQLERTLRVIKGPLESTAKHHPYSGAETALRHVRIALTNYTPVTLAEEFERDES
jgi:chromosome segregation ATPase